MAESANLELINTESEPVLEPVLEPTQEQVQESANELITSVKPDTDTISYIKCVGKLIVKEKISYNILGVSGEIIFSGLGFYSQPCIYIVILLKTSGLYTFEIDNQIVNKQGSGLIEFYVIKNISIFSTNIYTLKYTSTEPLAIYELNLADRCLCDSHGCF
jgi:hypothetical protein